ncbi:uncharacterized protein LOC108742322 [Agrilus planipennis]|uniref:Uncharacterized protein LOC108742322 n=1 Tax=Agrilus planipennis TaxID=224129 RepID=A0A1W4XA55_AGRPL|nr:uncharacterized protein LOC108742322 [Agrilus planipennis]
MNQLSQQVKDALLDVHGEWWQVRLTNADQLPGFLWKLARSLKDESRGTTPIHGERGVVYVPSEKAETFADCLEIAFRHNEDNVDDDRIEQVDRAVQRLLRAAHTGFVKPTNPQEIRELLKATNPRKASGPDGVSATNSTSGGIRDSWFQPKAINRGDFSRRFESFR